jgi:hypothetical protein
MLLRVRGSGLLGLATRLLRAPSARSAWAWRAPPARAGPGNSGAPARADRPKQDAGHQRVGQRIRDRDSGRRLPEPLGHHLQPRCDLQGALMVRRIELIGKPCGLAHWRTASLVPAAGRTWIMADQIIEREQRALPSILHVPIARMLAVCCRSTVRSDRTASLAAPVDAVASPRRHHP